MQKSTQNQKLKKAAYNFGRLANFIKVKVHLLKNNLCKLYSNYAIKKRIV